MVLFKKFYTYCLAPILNWRHSSTLQIQLFSATSIVISLGLVGVSAQATEIKAADLKGSMTAAVKTNSIFIPTLQDLSIQSTSFSISEVDKIGDPRWLEPSEFNSSDPRKTFGTWGKLELVTSCTDSKGTTFASSDEDYADCSKQISESRKETEFSSGMTWDKKQLAGLGLRFRPAVLSLSDFYRSVSN